MNVGEYIEYSLIEKDELDEFKIGKILGVDPKDYPSLDDYNKEIIDRVSINDYTLPEDGKIKFNDIEWYYDQKIEDTTTEQWCIMSEELSRKLEINTKLVALYFRPVGEKFNSERLDDISNQLLKMDISMFTELNKFFFIKATGLLANSKIQFLNQINHPVTKKVKQQLIKFGSRMVGILKSRKYQEITS